MMERGRRIGERKSKAAKQPGSGAAGDSEACIVFLGFQLCYDAIRVRYGMLWYDLVGMGHGA